VDGHSREAVLLYCSHADPSAIQQPNSLTSYQNEGCDTSVEADTIPGNEQNCKPEVGETHCVSILQGGWLYFIFSPQFEFDLEACCVIAAFIILAFLSHSGVYLPSSADIVQSTFKPQYEL